jgi:ferredoxin-NADP reductase
VERAAILGRLNWQVCDVVGSVMETATVRSLVLQSSAWPGHRPGQHVDIRLTAEDGYQAERSYSLAEPGEGGRIKLTVQRLPDGEVSPYLCDEVLIGDQLELRGPIGGYFVWNEWETGPVLLLGGGSGIVPLMAILAARSRLGLATRLLVSARSHEDLIYREALERLASDTEGVEVFPTLTRSRPPEWKGYARRVDAAMLEEIGWPADLGGAGEAALGAARTRSAAPGGVTADMRPLAFVCGPTSFVETVADLLVAQGYPPDRIRTERFGPTGV